MESSWVILGPGFMVMVILGNFRSSWGDFESQSKQYHLPAVRAFFPAFDIYNAVACLTVKKFMSALLDCPTEESPTREAACCAIMRISVTRCGSSDRSDTSYTSNLNFVALSPHTLHNGDTDPHSWTAEADGRNLGLTLASYSVHSVLCVKITSAAITDT